jgi:hypothetical protein
LRIHYEEFQNSTWRFGESSTSTFQKYIIFLKIVSLILG